ncbi:LIF receptor subunit alpha a [Micropterus dolomieu]|uniref:LIF receptor subunit alpha a n=1 Tax=Micropterus dolomieu TaxID=147949 RepID=UPI001E8DC63F|nr:LIF receptor subunit alpha a [Micropterus dolomieu]XP_045890557.1 LIF receptor subunit alpha a [Micropterus dolomieu]
MPCLVSPSSKPNWSPVWLICVLLGLSSIHILAKDVPSVPQQVSLSANMLTQQLSISWLGGAATTFDLIILRTELNETVFYETVSVAVNQVSGQHQWNWTSVEPLECTSLSIRIRSRDGQATSEWSNTEILQGNDLPSNEKFQMYPQDRVAPVGANTTFCCIVEEGKFFGTITYGTIAMNTTRLSRRTYATTAVNQGPTNSTGTNVFCQNNLKTGMTGTVVFVGYPPLPSDFVCETRDLISAVCQWNPGRDTHLYGKRRTRYSLNNRTCASGSLLQQNECSVDQWEGNWKLVAVNHLGQYSLTDSAELSHRVHPLAPAHLTSVVNEWNATLQWRWTYKGYSSLALDCQVELTSEGYKTRRTFSGVGLQSVVLSDLYPDEDYSVRVRCGAQQNHWKWGTWSDSFSFRTNTYVPDSPDVWMWMNRDNTGQVVWKLLTRRQRHGQITGYEVTLWSPEENLQHTETFSPDTSVAPINLTQFATFSSDKVIATVIAKNADGVSQPASVLLPLRLTDVEPLAVSRAYYTDSGFPLFWQSDANATCGYVVEWHDASCTWDCAVEWIKVAAGNTNVSIESANFQPGVRYTFSLYSCSSEAPELLQRWQGYTQELVPSSSVQLSTRQQDRTDIVLTWGEIPLANRRGFLLGYNIYISNGSHLTLLASLSDLESRTYTVKGFSYKDSYKFIVKAYTSAGEDTGGTSSITLKPYTDWLILEILTSLGITTLFLSIMTFICYKKRKWVKKAFYPDIPEPKLPGDWSRTQGPLDLKPSPHSMVHVVEKPDWDSNKEALVVIPEEDEDDERQGTGDEPVDTDEPTSLRYYNQVVDERPIRPFFPDSSASSASSLDSARTDVTYTGIQTSGSSLVFQLDPQGSSEGLQPQADLSVSYGGGGGGAGYRPQIQARAQSDDLDLASHEPFLEPQATSAGGYKPQSSWHMDSPVEAGESDGLAPSLGSPTSVASTQFLLPDGEEQEDKKRQPSSSAASWFSSLLSSTKP